MKKYLLLFGLIISAFTIQAQNGTVPELIYYKFDGSGSTVQNEASSPVGTNPAPLTSLTQGGTGQFGGALQGTGSGNVSSGWNLSLPGDWTMSFWIDFGAAASTFQYFLGDPGASSFRMFANGAAGAGNVTLRGPFTLDIAGVADGLPHVVHIVRDVTAGTVTAFVDGIQLNSINYTGTVPTGSGFLVGAYTSSMVAGVSMDEFRMYNRALDQTEITNTWNMELPLSFAPDDAGIASIDSPGVFCPGIFDIYATIRNYGTNVITTATINWAIDGVLQSPVNFTGNLDTTGGSGSPTALVLLGSFNFATNNPYTISAWTSMPNGVVDTVTQNDSTTAILQSNLPPPSNISTSALFSTQATITWTGGSANSWLYQNLPAGSTPTGFGTATSNANATISGLTQNTSYDFYVREVCPSGDTSAWALFSYTTPCAIYIAPFFENFDAAAWSMVFPYDIDQCWNRTSTTAPFWRTEDLTTGSSNTGPATDLSGSGKYVYFETSGGSTGSTNELISPPIDISSLSAPQVEFFYHMYGATIGTLNLDVLDSAGNWVNIWTLTGQQQVSSSDPWIEVSAPFVPSTDTVQFRFQGIRGTSFSGDMAVDEVRLRDAPNDDLALTAINGLQTACGLGSNESFTVDVENKGANTQNVFDIEYSVNGGAFIIGASASSPLAFGQTQTYTIAGVDLSGSGQKCIDVRVVLANDEDSTNNVLPQLCIFNQAVPSINSITNGEVCNGGPITLSATYTGDNLNWYDDAALTNQVNSGPTYTANFTQTTVLYLQAINANGCTAPIQTITAEVNFTPTTNFTSITSNCTVNFTALVSNNTDSVRWDFGDGVGTSNQLNPTYIYSNAQSFLINLIAYDGTCFKDTTKALFVNCQGVGLNSNPWAQKINMFPNPSQGLITIDIPHTDKMVLITVFDIKGQEVFRQEYKSGNSFNKSIDLSFLDMGAYFVNIFSGNKSAVKKLQID
ncbi:MAG: T9SS type A sorting domain-containing protein [Cytophagales bacterium]